MSTAAPPNRATKLGNAPPPAGDGNMVPAPGGDGDDGGGEEVKLYVGNLDYGECLDSHWQCLDGKCWQP